MPPLLPWCAEAPAASSSSDGDGELDGSDDGNYTSEDEEDDEEPLAWRAARTAADEGLPEPTRPARTRQNRFPKIPK